MGMVGGNTVMQLKESSPFTLESASFEADTTTPTTSEEEELTPFLSKEVRVKMPLGKQGVIILMCAINLINYIDRGIIPGSPMPFQTFIQDTLHIDVTQQSVYLGILASSFIASYSIFSMIFGYLSITFRPFRMIAFGMSVWVLAVVCCGIAQHVRSYYLLLFGRILSGVGEASFQCNASPFIDLHAPKDKRALYLGIFLSSITVGMAMGYIFGTFFGENWAFAFYTEGAAMVLLILACLFLVPDELDQVPRAPNPTIEKHDSICGEAEMHDALLELKEDPRRESPLKEIGNIFRNPTFTLVVLGHAAYTFSLAALSVFAPVLFIGFGFFETEKQVSMVFGGIVVITGTFGTPFGGILLDKIAKGKYAGSAGRSFIAVMLIFTLMTAGLLLALVMMGFLGTKIAFFGVFALCFFCLCALSPAETVAVMESFPASRRSLAVAANTLTIHVLGDVPSPIILGALKDKWAPHCGSIVVDNKSVLNPECVKDYDGLKSVLLFPILWMTWGVLLWGLAVFVVRRNFYRSKTMRSSSTHA